MFTVKLALSDVGGSRCTEQSTAMAGAAEGATQRIFSSPGNPVGWTPGEPCDLRSSRHVSHAEIQKILERNPAGCLMRWVNSPVFGFGESLVKS